MATAPGKALVKASTAEAGSGVFSRQGTAAAREARSPVSMKAWMCAWAW